MECESCEKRLKTKNELITLTFVEGTVTFFPFDPCIDCEKDPSLFYAEDIEEDECLLSKYAKELEKKGYTIDLISKRVDKIFFFKEKEKKKEAGTLVEPTEKTEEGEVYNCAKCNSKIVVAPEAKEIGKIACAKCGAVYSHEGKSAK